VSHPAVRLALCVAVCLAVGFTGAIFTQKGLTGWYPQLRKPSWNPPDRVFAPVWTALYVLMAVALWLVWQKQGPRSARVLFGIQLLLNFLWSAIFFGLRRPGTAAVEIVLLWASIAATLTVFAFTSPLAALLLVPYLAWVSFAAVLNVEIWRLNLR
jgi:benzodiazapine receptor